MHQYNYKNITKILPNYLVLVLDKILAVNILLILVIFWYTPPRGFAKTDLYEMTFKKAI